MRDLDRTVGLPVLRFVVERLVLGNWPVLAMAARVLLGRKITSIRPFIDQDFYIRQQGSSASRQAARTDAALHYLTIGRFHNLAPHPDFDPIAYREHNTHLGWANDPLSDFVAGRGRLPTRANVPRLDTGQRTIITLHHARGGGSARYLELLENRLSANGIRVVRLSRVSLGAPLFRASETATGDVLGPVFDLADTPEALADLLHRERPDRLVINHIVDLPVGALQDIARVCRQAATPFEVHLHDYLYLCPRINLIDADGRYCGAPEQEACSGCVFKDRDGATVSRTAWREQTHRFLLAAEQVVAPSRDTAARYARHWPDLRIRVLAPEDDANFKCPRATLLRTGKPVRVAVLGRLNLPKGFRVVADLAQAIKQCRLPIELILIGQSIDDKALRRAGVLVHGRYRSDEAGGLLGLYAPDMVFLPAIWPETWSFVLSLVLDARVPVAAFDLGAPAERLRALGFGHLIAPELASDPQALAEKLVSCARAGAAPAPGARVVSLEAS